VPRRSEHLRHDPDVRLKRLGSTGILLNLRTGDFFELDARAVAVWRRIDGKSTVSEMAAMLARQFKAPVSVVRKDVEEFVKLLARRRLVIRTTQPARYP
jgi:hypothetical protein